MSDNLEARMRKTAGGGLGEREYITIFYGLIHEWADEVAALEVELEATERKHINVMLLAHGSLQELGLSGEEAAARIAAVQEEKE